MLDARELAEQLDVQYGDILKWVRSGIIPAMKVRGAYVFHLAKVVDALRRHQAAKAAETTSCDV